MSAILFRFDWRMRNQRRKARACAHCRALVTEVDMVGHARWHRDGPAPGPVSPSVTDGHWDRLVVLDGEAAEVRET